MFPTLCPFQVIQRIIEILTIKVKKHVHHIDIILDCCSFELDAGHSHIPVHLSYLSHTAWSYHGIVIHTACSEAKISPYFSIFISLHLYIPSNGALEKLSTCIYAPCKSHLLLLWIFHDLWPLLGSQDIRYGHLGCVILCKQKHLHHSDMPLMLWCHSGRY